MTLIINKIINREIELERIQKAIEAVKILSSETGHQIYAQLVELRAENDTELTRLRKELDEVLKQTEVAK